MGSVSLRKRRDCFAYVLRSKPSPPFMGFHRMSVATTAAQFIIEEIDSEASSTDDAEAHARALMMQAFEQGDDAFVDVMALIVIPMIASRRRIH